MKFFFSESRLLANYPAGPNAPRFGNAAPEGPRRFDPNAAYQDRLKQTQQVTGGGANPDMQSRLFPAISRWALETTERHIKAGASPGATEAGTKLRTEPTTKQDATPLVRIGAMSDEEYRTKVGADSPEAKKRASDYQEQLDQQQKKKVERVADTGPLPEEVKKAAGAKKLNVEIEAKRKIVPEPRAKTDFFEERLKKAADPRVEEIRKDEIEKKQVEKKAQDRPEEMQKKENERKDQDEKDRKAKENAANELKKQAAEKSFELPAKAKKMNEELEKQNEKKALEDALKKEAADKEIERKAAEKKAAEGKKSAQEIALSRLPPDVATIAARFGDSLQILSPEAPAVHEHIRHLGLLPTGLTERMRKLGVRVILGNTDMLGMSNDPGYREAPRGWSQPTWAGVPGAFDSNLNTVFAGRGGHGANSLVLHEFGHAFGHNFDLNGSSAVIAHHTRLFNRLTTYEQQGGRGGRAGCSEFLAEAFADYFMTSQADFVRRYDVQLYRYMRDAVNV